jgi:hypothetical protein
LGSRRDSDVLDVMGWLLLERDVMVLGGKLFNGLSFYHAA